MGLDSASGWMIGGAFFLASMAELSHAVGLRCDWVVVALVRAVVMFTTAVVLVRASGAKLVFWRPATLWVRSLAGSFSLVCNFYAYTRLPTADAITLMNVHPLWIILISALILKRRPSVGEVIGVTCGLTGVVLIERPHLSGDGVAAIVALLSSVSSAVAMLGLNRLKHVDHRAVVAHFAGVATVVSATCLGFRWLSGPAIRFEPTAPVLGLLLAIGASGTIGQILLTKAYAAGAPAKVATVGLTQVVFAMIFDVAYWGRELSAPTLIGFALVLAPTTWLGIRSARKVAVKPDETRVAEPAQSG